jgi:hypothetical protein
MRPRIPLSELVKWQTLGASWALSVTVAILTLAVGEPVRSQEPTPPAESIADAARNARAHKSTSTKQPRIITNDDLAAPPSVLGASASPAEPSSMNQTEEAEAPKPRTADCDNPDAQRLKMDLSAAQEDQDQIRRDLSYQPVVISGPNLDLKNFKSGYSGLDVNSPPLLQTQPQASARVAEVILEEKVASLKRALTIACESPENAGIQKKLDQAEQDLHFLQRQFALDQATYSSNPNYAQDTAGKAKLDAEQQQIQDLQSEMERLKGELTAPKTNP